MKLHQLFKRNNTNSIDFVAQDPISKRELYEIIGYSDKYNVDNVVIGYIVKLSNIPLKQFKEHEQTEAFAFLYQ